MLVALLILGVIATFTIPKVLHGQQAQKKKAVFKETIAALSVIAMEKARTGTPFTNVAQERQWFRDRLNYVKLCATDVLAQGCWAEDNPAVGGPDNRDGYVLHNGVFIISINGTSMSYETIRIDWNGAEGPNTIGDDILGVVVCFGPTDCNAIVGTGPKRPGAVGPSPADNLPLWNAIFED